MRYGATVALHGIDLDVAEGEILVLVGGSGSGKTTLLRTLGGFLRAEAGEIRLDGADITSLPPHARPVTTMFQSYALFPHLDVAANIAFGLRRQRVPAAERRARIAELLDLVRLPEFGARRVGSLSGGQQQRVALARALAPRPRLLLLDEPLSALDRGLREETRSEMVALLRRFGITAIMVTHDQDEALATAGRIGVLHQGRLLQLGSPAELYERPANRIVATFLGAASILPATVRATSSEATILELPGGVAVEAPGSTHRPGALLHLALRPERLRLGSAGAGPNTLHGVIDSCAYVGAALAFVVRTSDGCLLRVTHALADGLRAIPEPGSAVVVSWPKEACILLES